MCTLRQWALGTLCDHLRSSLQHLGDKDRIAGTLIHKVLKVLGGRLPARSQALALGRVGASTEVDLAFYGVGGKAASVYYSAYSALWVFAGSAAEVALQPGPMEAGFHVGAHLLLLARSFCVGHAGQLAALRRCGAKAGNLSPLRIEDRSSSIRIDLIDCADPWECYTATAGSRPTRRVPLLPKLFLVALKEFGVRLQLLG
mmetsp:Transcript_86865/g.202202  ORF Transcript_86865/g.202202 Transcript_86865/m.202202 type:complete len:201 (+) Transcript_86865:212-814(+)